KLHEKIMSKKFALQFLLFPVQCFVLFCLISCENNQEKRTGVGNTEKLDSLEENEVFDDFTVENALLILPANPLPGENFKVLSTGGKNLGKAKIIVKSSAGELQPRNKKIGIEIPGWRIDDFPATVEGKY